MINRNYSENYNKATMEYANFDEWFKATENKEKVSPDTYNTLYEQYFDEIWNILTNAAVNNKYEDVADMILNEEPRRSIATLGNFRQLVISLAIKYKNA